MTDFTDSDSALLSESISMAHVGQKLHGSHAPLNRYAGKGKWNCFRYRFDIPDKSSGRPKYSCIVDYVLGARCPQPFGFFHSNSSRKIFWAGARSEAIQEGTRLGIGRLSLEVALHLWSFQLINTLPTSGQSVWRPSASKTFIGKLWQQGCVFRVRTLLD